MGDVEDDESIASATVRPPAQSTPPQHLPSPPPPHQRARLNFACPWSALCASWQAGVTSDVDTDGDGIPDIMETFDWVIVCPNDKSFKDNKRKQPKPQVRCRFLKKTERAPNQPADQPNLL